MRLKGFPKEKLGACIDYLRVTFKTHDIDWLLNDILGLKKEYLLNELSRKYGYVEKFELDQIRVYNSAPHDERGVMLELGGQGCRQLEGVLKAQKRDWFSFLNQLLTCGGKITRLDLAIDDTVGYIDIPDALTFTELGYVKSNFYSYDFTGQGNISTGEREGVSIYFGSKKSSIYLAIYQKNYEQAKKQKIPVDEIGLWNRYEVRLNDEKAMLTVEELLKIKDFSVVGKGILKENLSFIYDSKVLNRKRRLKKLVGGWDKLVRDVDGLSLKVEAKPAFYQRSENWLRSQAGATMRMIQLADDTLGRESTLEDIVNRSELSSKQQHMLKVMTISHIKELLA